MADIRYKTLATLIAVMVAAGVAGTFILLDDRKKREEYITPPAFTPEQFTLRPRFGLLGATPDWPSLERFQETITRERFERELAEVYSEGDAWKSVIEIQPDRARIETDDGSFELRFAAADAKAKAAPRFWRKGSELPPSRDPVNRPLEGLRVTVDAGHLGGEWAKMEERWYRIGGGIEVKEGELTLLTAMHLAYALRKGGAEVQLVRSKLEPVTDYRPDDFRELAAASFRARGLVGKDPGEKEEWKITREAERLFYRAAEIRQRAALVNHRFKPDLVICLHYNAESWGNPNDPDFVRRNHMHFLVNGTYSKGELRLHDQRYEMLQRLLQGTHGEESAVSSSVANALAKENELPPYVYMTSNAKLVGQNPYVYARNLLANRLYQCPVVFCEPYVMNNKDVYDHIEAGDYEGWKTINGRKRPSIFKEYALGIYRGLAQYYRKERAKN